MLNILLEVAKYAYQNSSLFFFLFIAQTLFVSCIGLKLACYCSF